MSRLYRQWIIGLSARYAGQTRIHGTAAGLNQYLWVMVYLDGLVRLTAQIVAKRLIYQNLMKEQNYELRFNGIYQHGAGRNSYILLCAQGNQSGGEESARGVYGRL